MIVKVLCLVLIIGISTIQAKPHSGEYYYGIAEPSLYISVPSLPLESSPRSYRDEMMSRIYSMIAMIADSVYVIAQHIIPHFDDGMRSRNADFGEPGNREALGDHPYEKRRYWSVLRWVTADLWLVHRNGERDGIMNAEKGKPRGNEDKDNDIPVVIPGWQARNVPTVREQLSLAEDLDRPGDMNDDNDLGIGTETRGMNPDEETGLSDKDRYDVGERNINEDELRLVVGPESGSKTITQPIGGMIQNIDKKIASINETLKNMDGRIAPSNGDDNKPNKKRIEDSSGESDEAEVPDIVGKFNQEMDSIHKRYQDKKKKAAARNALKQLHEVSQKFAKHIESVGQHLMDE